jgi:beta-glucosidase-like glycosyl hydrolase
VNGSACSQNSYLINNILKDELGFQGFVMSDWLSQISGVGSGEFAICEPGVDIY